MRTIGRYALDEQIASGGMATVHRGRLRGAGGFERVVAIKELHPHFARDPEVVSMLLDEARIAARIAHPNVVAVLDVLAADGELLLALDFVDGASLARVVGAAREQGGVPTDVAAAIVLDVLRGLGAAHGATDEDGAPLEIVHRDVSPENVLVGLDGVARVTDFGVAKARGRMQMTREGQLKGKIAYMAPEQIRGTATPQSDVYAVGVILWELLAGRRLFTADDEDALLARVLTMPVPPPRDAPSAAEAALAAVADRAMRRRADERFASAKEMAAALARCVEPATPRRVGEWLAPLVDDARPAPAADPSAPTARVAPAAHRAGRRRAALVALTAALAAGAVAFTLAPRATRRAAGAPADPAPSVAPAPSDATDTASRAPHPAPAAPPTGAPPPPSRTAAPAPRGAPPPSPRDLRAPPASPPSPAHPKCDPPYWIDVDGTKRFDPRCFGK